MKFKKYSSLEWHDRYTYKKNILFNDKDLGSLGAKFQIVRFAPGTFVAEHWHNKTTELFFVKSGSGSAIMNGTQIKLETDDILLCEPGDHHAFASSEKEELVLLDFKVNEDEEDIFWKK